jgi:hypothetical protein|tara:strand:+ start:787 stop:1038 length:252 start_codon:yes stop_codon:yes gene_type:complete
MATGDVTLSIAVEGGATKSVVIDSATRVKAKLFMDNPVTQDLSDDADWQVHVINKLARQLVNNANSQLKSETSYTAKTFTAAT